MSKIPNECVGLAVPSAIVCKSSLNALSARNCSNRFYETASEETDPAQLKVARQARKETSSHTLFCAFASSAEARNRHTIPIVSVAQYDNTMKVQCSHFRAFPISFRDYRHIAVFGASYSADLHVKGWGGSGHSINWNSAQFAGKSGGYDGEADDILCIGTPRKLNLRSVSDRYNLTAPITLPSTKRRAVVI
jgi:hypothetical protein